MSQDIIKKPAGLKSSVDSSRHFIHQINFTAFIWHVHTRVIFATVHGLVVTRIRFVCWNTSPLFPLQSSKPKSKGTTFLILIRVSPFWLDSGLKSITHHSSSYHQTDKLIKSLWGSYSGFKVCHRHCHYERTADTMSIVMTLFQCVGLSSMLLSL